MKAKSAFANLWFSMPLKGLILYCLLNLNTSLFAQYAAEDFIQYSIKDGLSDNLVNCITQDSRGFIWIGTEFGLNRFDGFQFEKYYQGSPEGFLMSSNISKISMLSSHRMAIITRFGVQVVNTADFSIQPLIIPDSTSFVSTINDACDAGEYPDGTIGVLTSSGYYVFGQQGQLVFRHDEFDISDIGNTRVHYGREIFKLGDDQAVLFVNESDQALYDIKSKTFRAINDDEEKWKWLIQPDPYGWRNRKQLRDSEFAFISREDSLIYYDNKLSIRRAFHIPLFFRNMLSWESKICSLDDSHFLINGGTNGLYAFTLDRKKAEIHFDSTVYLKNYKINVIFLDRDNRLWLGTSGGVLQQKRRPAELQVFGWPVEDISKEGFIDACRHKGKLYLGRYSRDKGLIVVDEATMIKEKEFSFFGTDTKWNEVCSMQMYHEDTLWLGTVAGIVWFDTKSHRFGKVDPDTPDETKIHWSFLYPVNMHGVAWMCDYLEGHVAYYEPRLRKFNVFDKNSTPPLPFPRVKHTCTDSYGDTWLAGHSLTRYNHQATVFDTVITVYGGPNRYEDDIKLIAADQEGSLWLHNAGNGLLQYKIREKEWTHYGLKDGFPSEVITSMSAIQDHTLWLTCQNQLIRFNTKSGKIEAWDQHDGIPESEPQSWNMHVDAAKQELYAFYHDEIAVLPFHYHRKDTTDTRVLFHEVIVNNDRTFFYPTKKIELGANENNLIVHFTLVDFNASANYKFSYRMNGDSNWISLGQQRSLHLTNLSPGSYSLEVSAVGKSGSRRVNTLELAVAPPFWSTSWFIIFCILAGLGIAYLLYKRRLVVIHQKANLDKQISEAEMKALHAQMNPHFIFNSLNSIREMILHNENRTASHFLGNFAYLIRLTLDQSRQSYISLRETMDYLTRYIEMEKIRNPDFQWKMDADERLDLDETILPPLLIQPLIENSIWHGLDGTDKKINIHVQFRQKNEQLICTIEDDGIGITESLKMKEDKTSGHQPVGIANIRKRIELLNQKHDQNSSISIRDKSTDPNHITSGTIITITLPLEIIEE